MVQDKWWHYCAEITRLWGNRLLCLWGIGRHLLIRWTYIMLLIHTTWKLYLGSCDRGLSGDNLKSSGMVERTLVTVWVIWMFWHSCLQQGTRGHGLGSYKLFVFYVRCLVTCPGTGQLFNAQGICASPWVVDPWSMLDFHRFWTFILIFISDPLLPFRARELWECFVCLVVDSGKLKKQRKEV